MSGEELRAVVRSLLALSRESEWVEFKLNDDREEEIGEYISALSNAAALHEKDTAYSVRGVDDRTHVVVGTTFRPRDNRIGNEELESWLDRLLTRQCCARRTLPAGDRGLSCRQDGKRPLSTERLADRALVRFYE